MTNLTYWIARNDETSEDRAKRNILYMLKLLKRQKQRRCCAYFARPIKSRKAWREEQATLERGKGLCVELSLKLTQENYS